MYITYRNGKEHELIYDDIAHTYKVEGVKIPSVTRIIDACFEKNLTNWAISIGDEEYHRVIAEALEIGNDTHEWIETYIEQGHATPDCGHNSFNSIKAFLKYCDSTNLQESTSRKYLNQRFTLIPSRNVLS